MSFKLFRYVILHSDQGLQFESSNWQRTLKKYNVISCMSRRGDWYDNAMSESFSRSCKKSVSRNIPSKPEKKQSGRHLNILRCFTTQKEDTVI